eukprot:364830-Chlamydomonas_euryale.AAC.12
MAMVPCEQQHEYRLVVPGIFHPPQQASTSVSRYSVYNPRPRAFRTVWVYGTVKYGRGIDRWCLGHNTKASREPCTQRMADAGGDLPAYFRKRPDGAFKRILCDITFAAWPHALHWHMLGDGSN